MDKPTVFISYSHKDEEWKDRLVTHLGVLQQEGLLTLWDDRRIGGGEQWQQKIQAAMDSASVAILLVSANSLTSRFILSEEIPHLLSRRDTKGLRFFPIIIKPCAWQTVDWLRATNLRPRDGRPLSAGNEHQIEADLAAIATEVYLLFQSVQSPADLGAHVPLAPDKISIGRLPITGRDVFGRELELKLLDGAWADQHTNVLSLVAWGGVGKSALVNHWLGRMAQDNYRGAQRVYAWSFYSQGTTDQAVSADLFIDSALRWFGESKPTEGSPWDKGERLANLVSPQRTLLVLDGLEPLQYPPGPQEGRLKDQALQALVRNLAAHNPGLCVISTRLAVSDLEQYEGSTARRITLEHLSPEAGAQVLKAQGVKGDEAELEQAANEFGGHSLALTLLGSYLSDVFGGDVRRRGEVGTLEEDVRLGGHARRVMASYEKWFGDGPELDVLRMLGLFNRPADKDAIAALRAPPVVSALTDALHGLNEHQWQQVLGKLRRAKLLAERTPGQPDTLDAHPLVREHFGQQLKRERPDAWRDGNNRLYEHLKRTTKKFPDNIAEMAPLYAAVAHGCEAGRHQEALHEVYIRRIQRGNEGFSTKKLSAFGADLAALTGFFDPPWREPVTGLTEHDKSWVLNEAGFRLRALGRLPQAAEPMQSGLNRFIVHKNWENASTAAENLSELYLVIGDLAQAAAYAQQGAELADRSTDSFRRIVSRSVLANAVFQRGGVSEAEATFREAEKMQKEREPQFPFLYSVRGFQYCDLLLDQAKYEEVQTRAVRTIEVARRHNWLLDIGLDYLSLGLACLLEAQQGGTGDLTQAKVHLNHAVEGLRQAGTLHYLPRGLLARAELYWATGNFNRASADLDEAMSIATRGSMGLHEADCHLAYTRLYLAQGEKDKARKSLTIAKEMIKRMGYHRRDKDLQEIAQQLGEG